MIANAVGLLMLVIFAASGAPAGLGGTWIGIGMFFLPASAVVAHIWSKRIRASNQPSTTISPASRPPRVTSAPAHPPVQAQQPARAPEIKQVPRSLAPTRPGPRTPALPQFPLTGIERRPNMEIAGEAYRIPQIGKAVGRLPKIDEEIEMDDATAELRPEPKNRHDPNAVMVLINGQHVGYLPAEVAPDYHDILAEVVAAGYAPVTAARIWIVARKHWETGKPRYYANVRVSLEPPHMIIPVNDPPSSPYSLLPFGRTLQVTGEENHLPEITEYLDAHGESVAIGTLRIGQTQPTRAEPKPVIEVYINHDLIGTLTPATSQHFIPTVEHLQGVGLATCAWLRIKGSPIAAQVTIHAPKAHEIDARWFAEPSTRPALHGGTTAVDDDLESDIRSIREDMWSDEDET